LTLSLIPYHEQNRYADIYAIQWQGTTLLESRVEYAVDGYLSLYFPTPMLFLGSLNDEQSEQQSARTLAEGLHQKNVLAEVEKQRATFESINPKTVEEIAEFMAGPGKDSIYRPLVIQQLISMAPADQELEYHAENLSIPGYLT
jgi:hypothetical protein